MTSITEMHLHENQLSGAIPTALGSLTSLTHLNLHENQLSGAIPTALGSLTSLEVLWLNDNQLSGAIPAALEDLDSITQLTFSGNNLSGAIPTALGDLDTLTQLSFHDNQLSGAIPSELGNLTSLIFLTFQHNNLSGAIPTALGMLTSLQGLFFHNNNLSGAIPTALSALTALNHPLTFHNNAALSGDLPTTFTALTSLKELSIQNTQVTVPTNPALQTWLNGLNNFSRGHAHVAATINLAAANADPFGLWGDGTTIWVGDSADAKLYAYTRATGAADSAKDLTLDSNNTDPTGLWGDGTTLWVTDSSDAKLYAYTLADGRRDSSKDLTLPGMFVPSGLWADSTTWWVLDYWWEKIFAYKRSDGSRDDGKDITFTGASNANVHPNGLWGDGTTLWVTDSSDAKLYAYSQAADSRDKDKEVVTAADNTAPHGLWGDGTALWVTDNKTAKLFAYAPTTVSFDRSAVEVREAAPQRIRIAVVLSAAAPVAETFSVVLSSATATLTNDYIIADEDGSNPGPLPRTLDFAADDTSVAFSLTPVNDTDTDADEVVELTFATPLPEGYELGTPSVLRVTIVDDDLPPGKPTLQADAGNGVVTLRWDINLPNNDITITRHAYRQSTDDRATWTDWMDIPDSGLGGANETSYTVMSLTNGTPHVFEVRAENDNGDSGPSDPVTVTPRAPPPPRRNTGGGGQPRDQHGNTPAQATMVALSDRAPWDSSTPGQLNPADDVDYFTFEVPHAGVLVVETTGSTDTVGTVWQDDEELGTADSGGERRNFRLVVPVEAGPVVVAVAGNGRRTGSYRLETRLLVGYLENPGPHSFQSGIGVLSGWVCTAEAVEIELNGVPQAAAYGTERLDTQEICGDTDNGFGLLFNWNLLGDGEHEVVAWVDGIEFSRTTVTVTTLGKEFVRDVAGTCAVEDFPGIDETVTLVWQQNSQNFVLAAGPAPAGANRTGTPGVGYLENPGDNSFQSGIGIISGWVCAADAMLVTLGDLAPQPAGYGTERLDTLDICGDTDNGFGLLFNWNRLDDGEHTVIASVDGVELGRAVVRVTTLGEEFLRGAEGECVVEDFPRLGQSVLLEWQQNSQNFVITDVQ